MSTSLDVYPVAISGSVAIPVSAPVDAGSQSGENCCGGSQSYYAMTAGEFGNTLTFVPVYAGPLDNACAMGYIDFSAFAPDASGSAPGSVVLMASGPNCKVSYFPCTVASDGSSVSYMPTDPTQFALAGQYQCLLVMRLVDTTVITQTGDDTDITPTSCPLADVRNITVGMPLQFGSGVSAVYTTVATVTPDPSDNSGVITYADLTPVTPTANEMVRSGPTYSAPFVITVSANSLACASCA